MSVHRVGGVVQIEIDGEVFSSKGSFAHDLGCTKREMPVGYVPRPVFIEGEITDLTSSYLGMPWDEDYKDGQPVSKLHDVPGVTPTLTIYCEGDEW